MGKKKQAQRTKNNVVPASSGRSAELLQSTSGVPFMGFSTLKEGGFIPILTGINDELDHSISEDFRLVWKKMNKKDTTTKLKALDEFKKLCQESDVEVLKPVLPYWPRLFSTLTTDEEHRVREAAHNAHRALVSKAGRNIAPYLKQLVGPWFTGQHDTYPPAASTAESAFQETFPPNKLVEVIVFCQYEILSYICNNLLDQTAQSLANNQNCSQEVKDARYQRVVVSCLNGYALYLQRLPVEHLRKAEEANLKLVSSAKFWRFNKDPAPIVRAAWFTALVALCEKAPFLLTQEAKHASMAVFSNIDETDPAVVSSVWQAALLLFNVIEDVWNHVSLEKLVLPKLWKVLREGADGNASLVFPNLLPLLSKVPTDQLTDKNSFYKKFFDNLRAGLKVRNIQISAKESSAVVTAVLECTRYLVSINAEDEALCLALLEEQVFPLLEAVMSDSKLQLARPSTCAGVASLANLWAQQGAPPYLALTSCCWRQLATLCDAALRDHIADHVTLAGHCAALDTLLTALKNPRVQCRKGFKVKFVSPRKSTDGEPDECLPSVEESSFVPSYEEARSEFVRGQISLCLELAQSCGDRARTVLIGHLARAVEAYDSEDTYRHILQVTGLSWMGLYRRLLGRWLRDDSTPLDYSLKLIFSLLKYVQDENDVQSVYSDLSGEETLASTSEESDSPLQPLYVKWQDILEWALKVEHQTPCVREWIVSHGGVCRLAALLTRHDPSYNILHNCLRNLRQINWLTTESLSELVRSLRHNLTDPMVADDVKVCSCDLLHAMLQNSANHSLLARLPTQDLRALLLELFTASLQGLPHFPRCWQHCLAMLSLTDLSMTAVCETCVDLLVTVIRTSHMDLCLSQKLVSVLEDLVMAATGGGDSDATTTATTDSAANLLAVVLNRLAARLRQDAEAVWSLYATSEALTGSVKQQMPGCRQFCSHTPKDPLGSVPLQQYVTGMIPFLMMVVRLQTAAECDTQFPYAQLRAALPSEDLLDWCLLVLQLQSLCASVKTHFVYTKQYFILRDKITFILEECGLFSQLKVKDLIKHLNLSLFEEGSTSLQHCDPFSNLQTEVVLKDLNLLYDVHQIQKDLLTFKGKNNTVKQYYFTEEVLEEIAALSSLEKRHLPLINSCHERLRALHRTTDTTSISILDRVFDQFVAEEKEDRSLLHLSDEELLHIAEVADFTSHAVEHSSAHLKQSSWDACLVAVAALTHSVATTMGEWQATPGFPTRVPPGSATLESTTPSTSTENQTASQPWPFNLLEDNGSSSTSSDGKEIIRLPLARVVRSVCRLFDSLSAHLDAVDPEDKAAVTRRSEWADVFLPGTHSAITRAWLTFAELPFDRPITMMLVEALSTSVARYVQYPHFVSHLCDGDALGCLDMCCHLLQSSETSVQLAAYHLLLRLIPALVELDMKHCESDSIALSCQHVDKTLVYTQSIIDVILTGLSFGDLCIVEPFTDSYTYTRCYLLLWCALLELCSQACSQLRALYTTWLKEEYLPVFMKTVFCLMPEAAVHGEVPSQRIAQLFSKPPQFDKGVWSSERLAQLSCWVFSCSLRRLPAAIRQWWNEAEHRVYALVEHVTATYVSPDLCADEMRAIQTQEKKFDNMTVHVHPTAKEVYAVYTLEESRMELVIELAHNHPLGLVKVRSGARMVSTAQTRQWLLMITILLTHQNGSIWDALELWKNSLDKRFEGVEECYICFAILHSVSHQLPKLSCQTCRKKFHSHCLYKWFTTSNKSTCPICRNLF